MNEAKLPPSRTMLGRLKSRQLLLLLALGEQGSLRRAAASLNIAQPAATKLLHELEHLVGTPLFERSRRGLEANAYGQVMIRHAQLIAGDLDSARHELAALATGGGGRVRVGAVPSAVPFLMARAIARLKREQPHLLVSVEVDTSNNLLPALARGDVDVVVARRWDTGGPALAYEELIDEPLAVAARPGHPLRAAGALLLRDLVDWPWALLPAGSPMRQVLAPLFREIGIERPANLVETSSMLTMAALLQQSDTLAVLPEDVVRYHEESGLLARLPVALPPIMGAYGIVTRRDRALPAGAGAFLASLRTVLHELRSRPG